MENKQFISLPESLFETTAADSFSGTVTIPEIVMGADVYRFEKPLHYDLFISNTGGAFLVSGTVQGVAEVACARCLDPFEIDLDAEIEAYFLAPNATSEITEDEEVEYEILEDHNKIDLYDLCRAAIALAVPYIPLCSEDCKGLCPQCGVNLNKETCACKPAEEDLSDNPFAVLKNLRFDSQD